MESGIVDCHKFPDEAVGADAHIPVGGDRCALVDERVVTDFKAPSGTCVQLNLELATQNLTPEPRTISPRLKTNGGFIWHSGAALSEQPSRRSLRSRVCDRTREMKRRQTPPNTPGLGMNPKVLMRGAAVPCRIRFRHLAFGATCVWRHSEGSARTPGPEGIREAPRCHV